MAEERAMFFRETKPYCDGCKRPLMDGENVTEIIRYRLGPMTYGNCCVKEAQNSIEGKTTPSEKIKLS
jgi:hypothetical protein